MKLALIGATGNVGTRILDEALRRGHTVTGIARNVDGLDGREGVTPAAADLENPDRTAELVRGHDAVIVSVPYRTVGVDGALQAAKTAGVKRVVVVGGAASLETEPGKRLLDSPDFPEQFRPEAEPAAEALKRMRQETALDWTYISPSLMFGPGERTGRFRLGGDQLLTDEKGESHISYEDYAIALMDEVENPQHIRQRFTVGY